MAWTDFLRPQEQAAALRMTKTPVDKVQFHLERYDRAIAQCIKPARLAQLKKERKMWQIIATAQQEI